MKSDLYSGQHYLPFQHLRPQKLESLQNEKQHSSNDCYVLHEWVDDGDELTLALFVPLLLFFFRWNLPFTSEEIYTRTLVLSVFLINIYKQSTNKTNFEVHDPCSETGLNWTRTLTFAKKSAQVPFRSYSQLLEVAHKTARIIHFKIRFNTQYKFMNFMFKLIANWWAWELTPWKVGEGRANIPGAARSLHGTHANGNQPCKQPPTSTVTLKELQFRILPDAIPIMNHFMRGLERAVWWIGRIGD